MDELNEKEKQLLAAIDVNVNAVEQKINSTISKAAKVEDIEAIRNELKGLSKTEVVEKMVKRLDEMEVLLKEKNGSGNTKSFKEQVLEVLNTDSVRLDIKSGRQVNLELKAASDMSFTATSTGQAGRVEFAPGIGFDPLRGLMLSNIIPEYPTNANAVFYIEALNQEGAPAFVNDSALAPQESWTITQKTASVKDVAVFGAYSTNMADDIDNFAASISQRLYNELLVKYDEKLYNGVSSGTDEFDGLNFYAQAFSVADASLKTGTPNLRDVLNAACALSEGAKGRPNFVLLNPINFRALKNTKLTTGQYALPWDISPVLMVDGLMVIANPGVTLGQFLVGDSTKGEQHVRQSIVMTIDPYTLSTKRAIRVTLAKRAAFFVRSGDASSFVKGAIADAITALTLP